MERLDFTLFLVVMALCCNISNVQADYFGGMFGHGEVQNLRQSCTEAQDCTNDNETCQVVCPQVRNWKELRWYSIDLNLKFHFFKWIKWNERFVLHQKHPIFKSDAWLCSYLLSMRTFLFFNDFMGLPFSFRYNFKNVQSFFKSIQV